MISRMASIKVFLGSFFLQSSWSFDKMQGLGFAASVAPALNEIYAGKDDRAAAFKRHLAYYNAHPYMASPVLGAVINIEERIAKGESPSDAPAQFKSRIMGPYGAIGDNFFWGALRPLASCVGILASFLLGLWGPLIFLVLYNIFHIWMRWNGLNKGIELGVDVVKYVKDLDMPDWSIRFRDFASAVLGVLAAVMAYYMTAFTSSSPVYPKPYFVLITLVVICATVALGILLKKGFIGVTKLIYAVILPIIIYGVVSRFM